MALSKLEAVQLMDLLNSNSPEKREEGRAYLAELEERECRRHKAMGFTGLDLHEEYKKATLNYPDNPLAYLPVLILLLTTFSMVVWALS